MYQSWLHDADGRTSTVQTIFRIQTIFKLTFWVYGTNSSLRLLLLSMQIDSQIDFLKATSKPGTTNPQGKIKPSILGSHFHLAETPFRGLRARSICDLKIDGSHFHLAETPFRGGVWQGKSMI